MKIELKNDITNATTVILIQTIRIVSVIFCLIFDQIDADGYKQTLTATPTTSTSNAAQNNNQNNKPTNSSSINTTTNEGLTTSSTTITEEQKTGTSSQLDIMNKQNDIETKVIAMQIKNVKVKAVRYERACNVMKDRIANLQTRAKSN